MGLRIYELKKEAVGDCKQNGVSVFDYYKQLTRLWEDLEN